MNRFPSSLLRGLPRMRLLPIVHQLRGALGALVVAALLISCGESPTQPRVDPTRPAEGRLGVYARSSALAASGTLVVQVSGPGIVRSDGTTPDTLTFNIAMANGVASGSITVPAGPQRVIMVRAFDGLTETHRGSVTTDIVVGANPTVIITLVPLVGDVVISVSIGTTIVIVRPGVATLGVGDTLRMSAEIRDQNGALVSGRVRWATLNPGRASVDTLGLVTMRDTGQVQIVATYGTVGGSAKLSGTPRSSAVAYQLQWNGSVNRNWSEPNNWTPFGIGAARVPTATDSVVITAGPANQPQLDACADQSVRDLVIMAGASLGSYCGYGVNVYRLIAVTGTISARVYARPGATLAGRFDNINVLGDTVALADSVHAVSMDVSTANAGLLLRGHRLVVDNAFNISGGTLTMVAGDTLEVSGSMYWSGGDETGKLTGGVVLFRGTDFYGYRYKGTGTSRLVFDRATAGVQSIRGFDFYNDPARTGIQRWDVRNRDGVSICGYVAVTDSITIASTGTASLIDNVSCGGYYVRANGPVITAANTTVSSYLWELRHATGTSLIAGAWSPTYTDVYAVDAVLKPSLSYQSLRLYASNKFVGPMTIAKDFLLDVAGTELTMNGQRVTVAGNLDLTSGALLTMTDPKDTLLVSGHATFSTDTRAAELTRLTAGLLEVGGVFSGTGFNAAGTHRVRLTGTATGTNYINGLNFQSYDQAFQHLDIASGATIGNCAYTRVKGTLTIRTGGTLQEYCGGYPLRTDGDLVTEAGSTLKVYEVQLYNSTGTQNVAGSFNPNVTSIYTALAPGQLKAGLGYINLSVRAAVTLPASMLVNGDLTVTGAAANLTLNGKQLTVTGRFSVADQALVSMTSATDSLVLNGPASWYGAGNHNGKLTAGVMILRGDSFCASGFYASGSHKTVFDRAVTPVRVDCVNGGTPQNMPFNNVEIGNYGVTLSCYMYAAGKVRVLAGAKVEQNCGGGNLWVQDTLFTAVGSAIANGASYPGSNQLGIVFGDSSGTSQIAGAYTPHWSYFTALHSRIKSNLGYHNVRIDRSLTFADSATFDGDLLIINDGTILALGGKTVNVRGNMDIQNTAVIKMDNPADQLLVATGDQTAHLFWTGGDNSGLLTNGVVKFNGARFYGPKYTAAAPQRFVFTGTANGAAISVEGAPTFGKMDITGTRAVTLDRATVLDTLNVASPVQLTGSNYLALGSGTGTLVSVAGSDILIGNVYLDGPTGTRGVLGRFRPTTTWFRSGSPTIDAIKPGLEYGTVHIKGPYQLINATTFTGALLLDSVTTDLKLNGKSLTVSGDVNLSSGAMLRMAAAAESLLVGGHFYLQGDAGVSTLTAGVLTVAGDYLYMFRAGSGASGTHKVLMNGTGLGYQDIHLSTADGQHDLRNLELAGTRPVRFQSDAQVTGTVQVSKPLVVTGSRLLVGGALGSVAGSLLSFSGVVGLSDASGTSQILGGYKSSNITQFLASASTIAVRTGTADSLGYTSIELPNAGTVSGGPLKIAGGLRLTTSSASLTVPTASTFGGAVETYGFLTFAGGAVMSGDLTVHRGGKAMAGGAGTDQIDSQYIFNNEGPQVNIPAGILDNTIATAGGGFRYKTGFSYFGNGGTTLGPQPTAHP